MPVAEEGAVPIGINVLVNYREGRKVVVDVALIRRRDDMLYGLEGYHVYFNPVLIDERLYFYFQGDTSLPWPK